MRFVRLGALGTVAFPTVWASVLGMALMWALNPALLGLIVLVISRARPVPSLLACWVGCLITNVPAMVVPLLMLHAMPVFRATAQDLAAAGPNSLARHIQLGMGVLGLAVAALLIVRARARQREHVPATVGNTLTHVLDAEQPTAVSLQLGRDPDAATERGSSIGRLISRVNDAWENGSLWVAFVVGLTFLPGPPMILLVGTTIAASGAPVGTQVIAAIAFVVGMLAVFEVVLVSYLVSPAKTQAVLRPLHDWTQAHRPQVIATILALVGFMMVVRGLAII